MTLMIGFWGAPVHKAVHRALYDACGPMPRAQAKATKAKRACTWPATIALPQAEVHTMRRESTQALKRARCSAVPAIQGNPWQHIPTAAQGQSVETQKGKRRRTQPAEALEEGGVVADESDEWRGRLAMPDARNHRFFVSEVAEFRDQVFNMPPIEG